MDHKAILEEIMKRNELRREAQLPALHVQAEFEHACLVAAQAEYSILFEKHADVHQRIRDEVLQELREKYGPDFGYGMGAKYSIGYRALPRYRAFLTKKHGIDEPPVPARSHIIYGEAKTEESTQR
jgi:hypothetical protein